MQKRCNQNAKDNAKLRTLKRNSLNQSDTKLVFVSDIQRTPTGKKMNLSTTEETSV